MVLRAMAGGLVVACALMSGCGDPAEGDVVTQYEIGEEAIRAGDALAIRNTYSTETVAWMEDVLRCCREASVAQTKALDPSKMEMVVMLRNRVDAAALKAMDVTGLIRWELDMDMFFVDADMDVYPHSVEIQGDRAVMQMGVKPERSASLRMGGGRRGRGVRAIGSIAGMVMQPGLEPIPGWTNDFVLLDGFWYADLVSEMGDYDDSIRADAKSAGKSVPDYIAEMEKEAHGSLRPTVWNPVR